MTQEEKDLLLRDLCARLPYGVKIHLDEKHIDEFPYNGTYMDFCIKLGINGSSANLLNNIEKYGIKPYLRPMSNMTMDEKAVLCTVAYAPDEMKTIEDKLYVININAKNAADYYNSHHLDYRGLIEKGLALEAPKDMYNLEKNNYGNKILLQLI